MPDPRTSPAGETPVLETGVAQPLGANWTGRGTNFAVLSASATRVELCLFDAAGRNETARLALPSHTGTSGTGFFRPAAEGRARFTGTACTGPTSHRKGTASIPPSCSSIPALRRSWARSRGTRRSTARWEATTAFPTRRTARTTSRSAASWIRRSTGAARAHRTSRGATRSSTSCTSRDSRSHPACPRTSRQVPRTRAARGHRSPEGLGITTVELMPVPPSRRRSFLVARGLSNYWGYSPIRWFAPDARYAVEAPDAEFRALVHALHGAGHRGRAGRRVQSHGRWRRAGADARATRPRQCAV